MRPSEKAWDWLGSGIYFWEHGPERALDWATQHPKISSPAVLGAYLNLGKCFDLLDLRHTRVLGEVQVQFAAMLAAEGKEMPVNRASSPGDRDVRRRELDCAILNWYFDQYQQTEPAPYQSVRAAFVEGEPVYPGSMIHEKTHIQIAVRDPDCILGYFRPR